MKTIINPPSPVKCKTCGCEFTFEFEDIQVDEECIIVTCPACGDEIVLKRF